MITITTDFGYDDHYVGIMKGVILNVNPHARIVDITHNIKRHSIRHASYVLKAIVDYFDAVHLFVVDPGVGTVRRGIVAELDHGFFVGPDNGILTLIQSKVKKVYAIKMNPVSSTFHGRDLFAPVAAQVDMGNFFSLEQVNGFVEYPVSKPKRVKNKIKGEIIYIDHFGNVITNIPAHMVKGAKEIRFEEITMRMVKSYGFGYSGELLSVINSENFLEFAVNMGSAEDRLKLVLGDKVEIEII